LENGDDDDDVLFFFGLYRLAAMGEVGEMIMVDYDFA
jgi:hypothetical protein